MALARAAAQQLSKAALAAALEMLQEVAHEAADEDETEIQAILSRAATRYDQYCSPAKAC